MITDELKIDREDRIRSFEELNDGMDRILTEIRPGENVRVELPYIEGHYPNIWGFQFQMIREGYIDIALYVPNPTANPPIMYFMRKK